MALLTYDILIQIIYNEYSYLLNYGINNNGSTDHDCLKVADYPFFEIFEFKEDDFRKKFAPQFEKLFNEPILLFNYESLKMKQKFSIDETLQYNIEGDFQKDFLQFCEKNEVMKELKSKEEYEQVKKILSENYEKKSNELLDNLKERAKKLKKSIENYENNKPKQ